MRSRFSLASFVVFSAAPFLAALLAASFGASAHVGAAEPDKVEFNRDIRPILSDKCFACHGLDPKHREGGLRLDTLEGATAEHEGHRAIVAKDLAKSELWQRIIATDADKRMPPAESNKTITDAEKALIKRWIEQGAPYQKHWAFEAPQKQEVPKIEGGPNGGMTAPARLGAVNPLDAFLMDRLKREKLAMNPEASRETLIRRVAFSLTGLPPTPAEVDDYLSDKSPDAYERMVDRYLASPRFGEEMARYWLDLARYADTHGLHLDNERQMWAYRDWVVNAFNKNQPFDKFTIEQLAGDLLPNATKEQQTATGFNRCNVTTSEGGSINDELVYRYAVDRTSTTMEVWLGLTGGCAVCHDHKFDPIAQREFYSMYAFFNSAADPGFDGNILLTKPVLKLATAEQDKQLAALQAGIAAAQKTLDETTAKLKYVDPATQEPKPPVEVKETVWLDDDFPKGAKVLAQPTNVPTQWINKEKDGDVVSGKRALRRSDKGLAQDYYSSGAVPFDVPPGGEFFFSVFLDPKDPPEAIMLQLHNSGWNQRAVWGNVDVIPFGAKGTKQRVHMGPLPTAGEWVKLSVSAEKLGLKTGDDITGFALVLYGGTVTWDRVGMSGRTDPAADPLLSMLAWRKAAAGKDTQGVTPEVNKLLKAGTAKKLSPAEEKQLTEYYLQNVCTTTKAPLAKPAAELAKAKAALDALDKMIPSTFVFNDLPTPRDSFVMIRGQYNQPGEKVEPGVPAVLPPLKKKDPKARASRLDLANWLVAPENPLTARVTVNRFWQQFFGTGLVKSSADFGSQGEPPSHPELLDWLALRFLHGTAKSNDSASKDAPVAPWDVKQLVRLMVTSAAFKQSARVTPQLIERDPENRLLARGPRFRLDAEQLRDNALFVSGLMDHTMGGKGVNTYQPPNIWEPVGFVGSNTRNYKQDTGSALYRRSLYTFLKRTAPPPFMVNFDGPNRESFCSRRERSNTPLQALQLMNDVQHIEAARMLGERIMREGGKTPEERITFAFRVVLARKPDADELKIVVDELAAHRAKFAKDEAAAKAAIAHGESKPDAKLPPVELASYTIVANMLLNLDETLNRN